MNALEVASVIDTLLRSRSRPEDADWEKSVRIRWPQLSASRRAQLIIYLTETRVWMLANLCPVYIVKIAHLPNTEHNPSLVHVQTWDAWNALVCAKHETDLRGHPFSRGASNEAWREDEPKRGDEDPGHFRFGWPGGREESVSEEGF